MLMESWQRFELQENVSGMGVACGDSRISFHTPVITVR